MLAQTFAVMKWLLRPQLWVASIAAALFFWGVTNSLDALVHSAPYVVGFGEDGDILENVTRGVFLRHELTNSALIVGMALYAWWAAANSLHQNELKNSQLLQAMSDEVAHLKEMLKHEKHCKVRTDPLVACLCGEDEICRLEREFHVLWRKASCASNYDKTVWSSAAGQLHAAGIIR